jgi:hypothetical protein
MAAKKSKKKQTKLRKSAAKRKPVKKAARTKLPRKKPAAVKRKLAKKTPTAKKMPVKARPVVRKATKKTTTGAKKVVTSRKRVQGKSQSAEIDSFASDDVRSRSAGQSGALQGLSDAAGADSESVDELIEEGNAFEAGIISGVEAADRADERPVRTREVPEDDVPSEYLDEE